LNELKERMLLEQAEMGARADQEKRDLGAKHEREMMLMEQKLEAQVAANREQAEGVKRLEAMHAGNILERE
jgi:hypothetical protein